MYRAAWINFKEPKNPKLLNEILYSLEWLLLLGYSSWTSYLVPYMAERKKKISCGWDTWDDGGPPKKPFTWGGLALIYPQLKSYVFHAFFPRDKQQGFWFPRSRNGVSGPENKFFLMNTCSLIGSRFLVHSVIDYSRSLKRKGFF